MSISVKEAGRKGGLMILITRGRQFYSQIGKKGQAVMRARFPGKASTWGKLGGRPRKRNLFSNTGEQG